MHLIIKKLFKELKNGIEILVSRPSGFLVIDQNSQNNVLDQ